MIGRILGHYRIVEPIGAGGMGEVYRAHDERLDRDVALKVLPQDVFQDEAARRQFRREAQALSRLNHQCIATVFDFDTQDGIDFLVLEYVPGETLANRLAAGALSEKDAVKIGIQVADGLAAAHASQVVHRDIKPSNLQITPDGRVKILDFGLARLIAVPDTSTTQTASLDARFAGTLPYMAPELLRDEAVDERADIYALGVVLYEMATGRRPFADGPFPRLVDAILNATPPLPRSLDPRLSQTFEYFVLKALDKDPGQRYQSAAELRIDLERLAGSRSTSRLSHPIPVPRRKLPRWTMAAAAVALLLGGSYAAWPPSGVTPAAPEASVAAQVARSIVILPFRNRGPAGPYDYFGIGLADVLAAKLTNARFLEVRSPRAALESMDPKADQLQVARGLGADAALVGTYLIEGDRLSLTYSLVDLRRDINLAGDAIEEDFVRSIDAERRLATVIVDALKLASTPEQRAWVSRGGTQQNEAFQAHLRSRYDMESFWRQPSAAALDRVRGSLERAIALDPQFSPPLVDLARLNWIAVFWGYSTDPDVLIRAEQAASQAIALDPTLGEAYAARALLHLQRGNVERLRSDLRAAFERSPNSALAHYGAGFYYLQQGLGERGVAAFQRARALDPDLVRREVGIAYRYQGEFAAAARQLRADLASHPDDVSTAATLAGVLIALQELPEAGQIVETLLRRSPDDPTVQQVNALLRVREGTPIDLKDWLRRYEEAYWADAGYCANVAGVLAASGDQVAALRWLTRARELGMRNYPFIVKNPLYAGLRGNRAFDEFLNRVRNEWEGIRDREARDPLYRGA